MNINILTSFIIAGMLLLMLAYMNLGVSNNSNELVLSQAKQSQKIDIQELITNDFPKIGYDFNDTIDTLISNATDSSIVFFSNIDNSADGSIETIIWEMSSDGVSSTANTDDRILRRTAGGDVTEIVLGVTNFKLRYFDKLGSTTPLSTPLSTADIKTIRQIEVTLEVQSAETVSGTYGGNKNYITSIWTKRFTPRNLQTNL
jgi:hypothetical protein